MMSFCFPARLARRASAAPQLLAKTFRVIPPASAAIPALVSSAHSAADAIAAAVAAQTAVADVLIAEVIAVVVLPVRDSNAVPAVLAGGPVTIAVIAAIPDRPVARSSSAKC